MYTPDRQINPDCFYEKEAPSEKCHCAYCDGIFDLEEMARVRVGNRFEYRCLHCDLEVSFEFKNK